MNGIVRFACAGMGTALAAMLATASAGSPPPTPESEYVAALRTLKNGLGTVEALNLPPSFLQRIADTEIRGSFRKAVRKVASDPVSSQPPAAAENVIPNSQVDVRTPILRQELVDQWMQYSWTVPNIAGFRAPLGAGADDPWPFDLMQRGDDAGAYRESAIFVSNNLAREGLIKCTLRMISRSKLEWTRGDGLNLSRLRAVGVPVDLFSFFSVDGQSLESAARQWLDRGANPETIDELARRARFGFTPSCPGRFEVLPEDGSENVGVLRLQLPTHRYRLGEGDGSVLDVFRQLTTLLPETPMWVSMHEKAMPTILRAASQWNVANAARFIFVPNSANVTQWAQDNGKAGRRVDEQTKTAGVVTLVPRYASLSEMQSTFVPSDSFVMESLNRARLSIVQSPLMFQGGNLLPVVDPRNGERLLLVGEAEILRNMALGLSADQVQQALAVEFGVRRVVILPAPSFHLDLDVTIRQCNGELVACVIDELAATRMIYPEGLKALERAKMLPSAQAGEYAAAQSDQQRLIAINNVLMATRSMRSADQGFSKEFAGLFVSGPLESPSANAQRFLAAMDILFASCIDGKGLSEPNMPSQLRAYISSLKHRQDSFDALVKALRDLGMQVHRIPGLSDRDVNVNAINGIHLTGTYFMPSFGGWFEFLDRAATEKLHQAFGPTVAIVPVKSGIAQASDGGLHCMVGLSPRVN